MKFKSIIFNYISFLIIVLIEFILNISNKINLIIFYKSPLIFAVEKQNVDIVNLLLTSNSLDINFPYSLFIQH